MNECGRARLRRAVDSAIDNRRRMVESGEWSKLKLRESIAADRHEEKVYERKLQTLENYRNVRYCG